jgi:Transcriptional regulator
MPQEGSETKKKLIIAAGKLFAEKGYEGVSTRMIAEEAKVNLGGIHYHFGSKEKLYVELFRFVLRTYDDDKVKTPKDLDLLYPEWHQTPEGQAKIVYELVRGVYRKITATKYPWKLPLFVRESFHPSPAKETLIEEVFRPLISEILNFCRGLNLGLPEEEIAFFAFFPSSQVMFYLMRMQSIREISPDVFDENSLYEHLTRFTAKAMILYLGLPLPEELKMKNEK